MYRKTYKYRLYPNKEQEAELTHTLDVCRNLYNEHLADRKNAYERCNTGLSLYDQTYQLKYIDHGIYAQVAHDVLHRLDKSFKNFFRRVKNGEKPGYPRFQGWKRYDSFTYPQKGFKIVDGKLHMSKIGDVKIILHRPIEGKIKTLTVRRDGTQWYACFSVEMSDSPAIDLTGRSVGVDVGIRELATLSDGNVFHNAKHTYQNARKLAKEQRRLARKKKGSQNREKQRHTVRKVHRTIRNARNDTIHNISTTLVRDYDVIVFEDLKIKNMVKNHKLAKSIHDVSWNQLMNATAYKAEWAGKSVEFVNPANTSKECSECGHIQDMPLSVRQYDCPVCGLSLDRDVNAAKNILQRYVGQCMPDLMPVGGRGVPPPVKQEADTFDML